MNRRQMLTSFGVLPLALSVQAVASAPRELVTDIAWPEAFTDVMRQEHLASARIMLPMKQPSDYDVFYTQVRILTCPTSIIWWSLSRSGVVRPVFYQCGTLQMKRFK